QIEEGLKLGALHPLAAEIAEVYEAADAKRREIEDGGRFSQAYKRSQIDAIEADTAAVIEKAKVDHRKRSTRPLDSEEGQIRAAQQSAANDPAAAFREARATRFRSLMANALDGDAVDRIWHDALLTNDVDAISGAASSGLKRLADRVAETKSIP